MPTLNERAAGLSLWAIEGATREEVAEKLVELDQDAMFWRIAQMTLPSEQIERIEHMARHLVANGYNPDETPEAV